MKRTQIKPLLLAIASCLYFSTSLKVALADDTEIYVPKQVPADQQVRPNILLILDTSGSMTSTVSGTKQRIQVLREVVHNLVHDLKDKNVNLGFMRFHGSDGGAVTKAVEQLTPSNAETFLDKIDSTIKAGGNTPMSETYYEAYLYLAGKKPHWGKHGTAQRNGTDTNALVNSNATCTSSSQCNWQYKSPISHSCQKTHIVYITDGAPVSDNSSNKQIRELLEKDSPQGNPTNPVWKKSTCKTGNGECLPHLAEYMYNQDIAAENGYPKKFSDPTNRKQNVTSHFVGFALDLDLLVKAAEAGGGHYFTSNTASGLADALQSIVVDITASNTTFVAPSVAVTSYNNFGFRDELYYALFRPAEGTNWLGNLKKYKLKTRNSNGDPITPIVVDRNGTQAIDPDTGFFKSNSSSFWHESVDGDDVGKGGFAANLTSNNRKIYTWFGEDKQPGDAGSPSSLKVLANNGVLNSDTTQQSNISNSMLGVTSATSRTATFNWILGKNPDGSGNRLAIGDILHNEPRLVAYTTDEDIERAATSNSKEEVIIFIGTNEGFIHAVDAKSGKEKFAFLPKELLHIPNKYRVNDKGYNNKAYGMDGYFTTLTEYGDRHPTNDTRTATKVNLYAGMRRGGSNYYALDVSNLDDPKLKWVIKGAYKDNYRDEIYADATEDNYENIYRPTENSADSKLKPTPGFERLGLTYSAAKTGKLKVSGQVKDVLVFTGGYDVKQDIVGENLPKNDEVGNAIYIVDAESGALLWRASGDNGAAQSTPSDTKTFTLSSMTNSIPASPTLIDTNSDGLINVIYAADVRGQIFRFNIPEGNINNINGYLFAKLGGNDAANNRRFFNSPDVAMINDRGQAPYFTVSIGSGFRENPLNEQTDDRFYMIRDPYVYHFPPASTPPATITESDLTDVSILESGTADANQVYEQIDLYQAQIDQLEATLLNKEQDYKYAQQSSGYTEKYNAYLNKIEQAQSLQRDIDGRTIAQYSEFDHTNFNDSTRYNPDFLAQHAADTTAQAQLQKAVHSIQSTVLSLQNTDPNAADELAKIYDGLLSFQDQLDNISNSLVSDENFILTGHAMPALTPELKTEIETRFPGAIPGNDYSAFGDFSDLAYLLNAHIENRYTAHSNSLAGQNRKIIGNNLESLNSALNAYSANPDTAGIAAIEALLPGVTPSAAPDVSALLARDETTKLSDLNATATSYSQAQNYVEDKTTQRDIAMQEANIKKTEADIILDDHNGFQIYLDDIESAYNATLDPDTGIYALRVLINEQYKLLDLADGELADSQKEHLLTSKGFMLRLPRGEKVLADSISYSGSVLFSTFSPRGQLVSECGSDVGHGRTYGLSLRTSEGIFTEMINGKEHHIRSMQNLQAGIPPTPVVLVTPEGTEGGFKDGIYTAPNDRPITPIYWREEENE